MRNKTFHRKKTMVVMCVAMLVLLFLIGRLWYLMIVRGDAYKKKAEHLHERERKIKAARGEIVDRNGKVLATNRAVCTISVVHNQVKDPEKVIQLLSKELGIEEELVRKRVEKISALERIRTNVEKEIGDRIREYHLEGVKVDEDFKRYYPYNELGSKVLGFTGADNQGIVGLEVMYESYLKGKEGEILATTDARGVDLENVAEERKDPEPGDVLQVSLDYNIQKYAQQEAYRVMEEKQANRVSVLIMNPQNGEIYAMVNAPEFDLNQPFLVQENVEHKQEALNQMWRNPCINDTYEPGSTFKIITSTACLEEGVVSLSDQFHCPGYRVVEDRRIRCHKTSGHGAETFVDGVKNSCNPVFIDVGLRLGVERFYHYFYQFGLMDKTGVDLPGEASTIMHKKEHVGNVELATMSFGQSFQVTPIQMATTISTVVNGGVRVTPHFGVQVLDQSGKVKHRFSYKQQEKIVSNETSQKMCDILEKVVSEGSGKNAYIEGYRIGGKTATSQTFPRSARKYISSFVGFAPANHPQVIAIVVIHNPQGIYYGGTIAAPVVKRIFENILPYLGIEKETESLYTN